MKSSWKIPAIAVGLIVLCGVLIGIFAPKSPVYVILFVTLIIGTVIWLIRWHSRNFGYQCSKCGYKFAVSGWTDALSPHMFSTKLLRCPKCGESDWFKEIHIREVSREVIPPVAQRLPLPKNSTGLYIQIFLVVGLYLLIWAYTLYAYGISPKTSFFTLPAVAGILPFMQVVICGFAIRRGYNNGIYIFITFVLITDLVIFFAIQYSQVSKIIAK